jgi:aspartyl-tRNA(Asn)/glutamyl-tRNA(Gln) amidotransferase subunit A
MLGVMAKKEFAPVSDSLRIAYAPTINNTHVDPQVAARVKEVAKSLKAEEIDFQLPNLVETFNMHWGSLAAWMVAQVPEAARAKMDQNLIDWARRGAEFGMAAYQQAELNRLLLIERLKEFFKTYDALILPTTVMTAFPVEQNSPLDAAGKPWEDWTPFTYPANLGQLPAASVPCGLTREGLPVGAQIVSGAFREDVVFQVARQIERNFS